MDWRKLDPRMIAVHTSWLAPPAASFLMALWISGGHLDLRGWLTLSGITLGFLAFTAAGVASWAKTRYRLTADAVEVRTGMFTRKLRTVRLNRIRNVDLTASPVHRLFGLTTLRIGTAGSTDLGSEVKLDALAAPVARALRAELLARATHTAAEDPVVSTINPRWLRYAPLTFWIFGGMVLVLGVGYRALEAIGIEAWRLPVVRRLAVEFGSSALWWTIPLAFLASTLLGVLGALALYVEGWWRYRLEWVSDSLLRVRRGLLTTRSVSIERCRLFGAVLREPLLLRFGGGAKVNAVAAGLGTEQQDSERSAVLPPAPRAEALRVVAGVLREPVSPLEDLVLTAHPKVAHRRRIVRGLLLVTLPLLVVPGVLGYLLTDVLLHLAWSTALASVPFVLWFARDAYRNLGHGLSGRYLVARSGTISRDTAALRRADVLSWTFADTPFSRRAGVVTLTAAVATVVGGYHVRDMAEADSAGFAERAVPGILTEFLDTDGSGEQLPAELVHCGAGGPVGADGAR
ncbi:PH domain-containing protein [Crossiella sp. CA-258035]|uniref:PH domain-containing protein n=1 Tax=Crossiella sp. CA-258035 TaxID=2981138 RepID=UPI0024BD3FCE|nr:PH domain-containing protein [Crossiella sp. CA-258035]WHT21070.1 PH domain-containing protein [Crossiella sp. CA-258035]